MKSKKNHMVWQSLPKWLTLVLLLSVFSTSAYAQKMTNVSGLVADRDGNPIVGVNVFEKVNPQNGVITDLDGKYAIKVSDSQASITFRFIGFEQQDVKVNGQSLINVILLNDIIGIDEVIAVGYGVQKKGDLTGSVELVKGEKLKKQNFFQTSSALQGAVPGLTVIQSSGQPGSDNAALRIRGVGSININNSPLILIDGVAGDINGVDAADIENVTVLKDAGAAAIYGSRASNGVILVTTKRGSSGETSISYNGYTGFQKPTNIVEMLDSYEYLKLIGADDMLEAWKNSNDPDLHPNTNWVDKLLSENGAMQYHNLTISAGTEKSKVQASLAYQDQDGNIPNFGFKRYQGRINTDFIINNYLKISLDANYRQSEKTEALAGGGVDQSYRQLPTYANKYSDGRWHYPVIGGNPILFNQEMGNRISTGDYFRARAVAEITPIKNLSLKFTYSPEIAKSYASSWAPKFYAYGEFTAEEPLVFAARTDKKASLGKGYNQTHTNNFNAVINYKKEFNSHNFDVLAGTESIQYKQEGLSGSRYGYILPDYPVIDNGNADNDNVSGNRTHYALLSYFSRLNYSFDNRYYLTANVRKDGSSRFYKDSRWGVFPSFSAGWNLHNEAFFPKNDFLTRLKLRGSWGKLGNETILNNGSQVYFPYASLIAVGTSYFSNGMIQQGAAQNALANTAIEWEKAKTVNFGVDYGVWSNKISGSIEYYKKETNDLIAGKPIPYTTGLSAPFANVFSMSNSGIDFSISYKGKIRNLKVSVDGNFATVKNEVTDLGEQDFLPSAVGYLELGEPIYNIYTYKTIGIFQSEEEIEDAPTQFGTLKPGDLRYEDIDSYDESGNLTGEPDGKINSADRQVIGNSFPKLSYGFNINLDYKGFDLTASFTGVGNRDVLLGGYFVYPLYNGSNAPKWIVDQAWTEDNRNARYPVITNSTSSNNLRSNSTYMYNGSYLRFRNLIFGYTLPKNIVEKASLSNVRFYVSGQNLFTLHNMPKGIDPTTPNGSGGNIYPVVKSYTFGVNVSF